MIDGTGPGGPLTDEERYRLLAENATDVVALTHRGVLEWVSPSVADTLGWSPQELVGRPTDLWLHPDDVAVLQAARADATEGRRPRVQVRLRARDGGYRWFESVSGPYVRADGRVDGAVSSLRDITAEVDAEAALTERDDRLRSTLDGLLDPCVLYQPVRDDAGRVVDFVYAEANRAACEYNGLAYDEMVGHRLLELFPTQVESEMFALFVHAADTGEPMVVDSFGYHNDLQGGQPRRYDIRAIRLDEALSVTWRDVTERDESQLVLAASEARYGLLAERTSDVVCQTDAAAVIRWVSPSVARVLGWRPEEVVGRSAFDLVDPEDVERLAAEFDRMLRGEVPASAEYRVRAAGGDLRWMAVDGHRLEDDDGEMAAVVVGLRDCHAEVVARRAHLTLSAGSALLVRAEHQDELLDQMCQIAVDHGGYLFSWYGRPVDDADRSVEAVACSHDHRAYLDLVSISWGDGPLGQGPGGTALRTGRTAIVEDLANESAYRPWLQPATSSGFRCVISLPVFLDDEIDGALMVYAAEVEAFDDRAVALLEDLAAQLGYGLTRLRDRDTLDRALDSAIDLLAAAVESRDPYTAGHQSRVATIAVAIGEELGLPAITVAGLSRGASIHDVGKIAIPTSILTRPGRLADEEMALVRRHALVGWEIVSRFEWPWPIAEMVRQHHERMNGSGYPDGLVGDDILFEARIIAVADVFEAMAANRPYRTALGVDAARAAIVEGSGVLFDPTVVAAFERVLDAGFAVGDIQLAPR